MERGSIKYIIAFILICSTSACEEEVRHVKLPPFEQKLVIASFISPSDSICFVTVSSNRRLYGELNDFESSGSLSGTISDGNTTLTLDSALTGLKFRNSKIKTEPGKTYRLKVMSDKGLSAEGECTVPQQRDFMIKADTSSVLHSIPGYNTWREFNIDISFNDFPGEVNYFRLNGTFTGYMTPEEPGKTEIVRRQLSFSKELFTDNEAGSGSVIKSSTGLGQSFSNYDSAFIKIYLLNTEKSYYLYHKSLEDYNSGDDPFSEVTPVYSNITGGLGVFTSFTVDSLIFRLK